MFISTTQVFIPTKMEEESSLNHFPPALPENFALPPADTQRPIPNNQTIVRTSRLTSSSPFGQKNKNRHSIREREKEDYSPGYLRAIENRKNTRHAVLEEKRSQSRNALICAHFPKEVELLTQQRDALKAKTCTMLSSHSAMENSSPTIQELCNTIDDEYKKTVDRLLKLPLDPKLTFDTIATDFQLTSDKMLSANLRD